MYIHIDIHTHVDDRVTRHVYKYITYIKFANKSHIHTANTSCIHTYIHTHVDRVIGGGYD